MPTEILLPQWGMEMQDGTIVKWLKKEGDTIEAGEPLVEVETRQAGDGDGIHCLRGGSPDSST